MAQNVTLLGASYADVPAVQLPKTGGGTALFADPSGVTSVAADVAQGKIFMQADGSLGTGTASGGGGGSVILGALRPDAVLVQRWTQDKMVVRDLGKTIPAYSTTASTLVVSATLSPSSPQGDFTQNAYYLVQRVLATPVYNTASVVKGKPLCWAMADIHEYVFVNSALFQTASSSQHGKGWSDYHSTVQRLVFYSSTTATSVYTSASYGIYSTFPTVSFSSNTSTGIGTITPSSPSLTIRGSSTYLSSTVWPTMTDIRFQYVIEIYRVPNTASVVGWGLQSQFWRCADAFNSGGTLT